MQISILLMEQIFELFLMILMGFIIVKAGIVKEEDSIQNRTVPDHSMRDYKRFSGGLY